MRKTYPGPDVIMLHINSELTPSLVSTYNYCSSGLHSVRYDEASAWCSVELHGIINHCRAEFIAANMNLNVPLLSVRDTVIDMWYKVCFGAYRKMQRYYANLKSMWVLTRKLSDVLSDGSVRVPLKLKVNRLTIYLLWAWLRLLIYISFHTAT